MEEHVTIEHTLGSVYHALGKVDAGEMELKARLVSTINDTIRDKGLTQVQASEIVGLDQPTLSKLLRGLFRSVSLDKLAVILNSLGRDVIIVVGAMPQKNDARGRTLVAVS